MRMKRPPQPLVFRFDTATDLCGAVAELYGFDPAAPSALCSWRGRYFLQVCAGLTKRKRLAEAVGRYGSCLGASPVLYSFCQEHGAEISRDAVRELGAALCGINKDPKNGKNSEE